MILSAPELSGGGPIVRFGEKDVDIKLFGLEKKKVIINW
jgi:hypothetical protein